MARIATVYKMAYLIGYVILQAMIMSCEAGTTMNLTAPEACANFDPDTDDGVASWELDSCMDVWNKWSATIDKDLHIGYPDRGVLQELSKELRDRGSPCLVRGGTTLDGLGSAMVRQMSAWLYAKDVGCDWIAPDFNQGNITALYYNDWEENVPMYCHRTQHVVGFDPRKPIYGGKEPRRCAAVSWINFFHLVKFSTLRPTTAVFKTLKIRHSYVTPIQQVVDDTKRVGLDNVGWDLLELLVRPQEAVRIAAVTGSWDAVKREHARKLLHDFREGFHESPRLGYPTPTCPYNSLRLNFAVHIRLGDRGGGRLKTTVEYLRLIESLMKTITEEVEEEGQPSPLFHVFSETQNGCPSETSGSFDEFPQWVVDPDEIRECVDAKAPDDCPEKQAGGDFCYPQRSGVFHVTGAPIILNLGTDMVNTFGCMSEADGIIMGCSCFGIAAGILSKGMKLFSVSCEGQTTWEQNQIAPPLAVAERGEMWVPIAGSWRDPVLENTNIFKNVLGKYMAKQGFTE